MDEMGTIAPGGAATDQLVKEFNRELYKAKGWMKLIGVLSIIQGIMMIFSIWGILICWLPIWVGVLLNRAAGRVEMAYLNGDRDMSREGMQTLGKYFTINGVLALIVVIVMALGLVAVFTIGGLGFLSALGNR